MQLHRAGGEPCSSLTAICLAVKVEDVHSSFAKRVLKSPFFFSPEEPVYFHRLWFLSSLTAMRLHGLLEFVPQTAAHVTGKNKMQEAHYESIIECRRLGLLEVTVYYP